jgi:carboxylesterase 2
MMTKLSLLIGSAVAATGFAQDVKVETNSGPVVGSASANVQSWLGIPFAKSPPARFGAPEDPVPWTAPLAAKQGKNSCMQQFMCSLRLKSVKK